MAMMMMMKRRWWRHKQVTFYYYSFLVVPFFYLDPFLFFMRHIHSLTGRDSESSSKKTKEIYNSIFSSSSVHLLHRHLNMFSAKIKVLLLPINPKEDLTENNNFISDFFLSEVSLYYSIIKTVTNNSNFKEKLI